jgi:hypothetical protein
MRRKSRWYDDLSREERAYWEGLGLEAAQKTLERRGGDHPDHRIHIAIAKWATEERSRAGRPGRRSLWLSGAAITVSVIVAASNWWHWRESETPKFVSTDARLYINHSGNPPPELVQLYWRNGNGAAFRGKVTLFTVSEGGNRPERFEISDVTAGWQSTSTTIAPFSPAYAQIPVDMTKFLGLFLACVKYYDEENHSHRQTFLFRRGAPIDVTFTQLNEVPSKPDACHIRR